MQAFSNPDTHSTKLRTIAAMQSTFAPRMQQQRSTFARSNLQTHSGKMCPTAHLRHAQPQCCVPARNQQAELGVSRTFVTPFQRRRCAQVMAPPCAAASAAGSFALPESDWESLCTPTGFKALAARLRAIAFFSTSVLISLPLFVVMVAIYPLVMLFDSHRRQGEHLVNFVWAKLSMLFYNPVKVEGAENIPPVNQPAVYVANHLSFLDIFSLFHLARPFKFISKTSNFLIPIIGWSMFLTGHIMINRTDKKSQLACLKQCGVVLKEGASVLFFPEGTRSDDGKMHGFKKGAFSVAAKAKVPVVPITLVNTGDMMPNGHEYLLYPGQVHMVVHPPIPPSDAETMMNQAYDSIAAGLPASRIANE